MSKHVLVISTSLRKGNSERLAQEFAKGAAAAGHQVEELTLRGKRLTFCTAAWPAWKRATVSFRTTPWRSPQK